MPSYNVLIHNDARKVLNDTTMEDADRVKDTIREIAATECPAEHPKVELLSNDQGIKLHKARVGDYRILMKLEKPELQVLKVSRRQGAYRDVDDIYASL